MGAPSFPQRLNFSSCVRNCGHNGIFLRGGIVALQGACGPEKAESQPWVAWDFMEGGGRHAGEGRRR